MYSEYGEKLATLQRNKKYAISEATNENLSGFYITRVLTMNFLFQCYPYINSHVSLGIVSITVLLFSDYSPQWLSIT